MAKYYDLYSHLINELKEDPAGLDLLYEFHNRIIDHIRMVVRAKSGNISEPKFYERVKKTIVDLNYYIRKKNRQENTNIKTLPTAISRTEIRKFWSRCEERPSDNNEHPPEEKEKWNRRQRTLRYSSKVKKKAENEIIQLLNNLNSSTITKKGNPSGITIKTLRDIITDNPKDYLAHLFLGILYAENKQFKESKKEILKALGLNLKLGTLKLIELKKDFSQPLQFLSLLAEILEESFLDYEIYSSTLMVLDNWEEYEKCSSLCEIKRQSFYSNDYDCNLIQHNTCFYRAIVTLKKGEHADAKRFFLHAASCFDRLLEKKSEYFYLGHSFMRKKPPRPILVNEHFRKLLSLKNLKELRKQTKNLVDYHQNECLSNRLDPKEFEKWGYFVSRYHLSWQITIAHVLNSALSFKQFDTDTMKEAAHHAMKKGNVEEKKIFNALENFISLLSQYKSFGKAQKDEATLLKELWKVSDKSKDLTDVFEQLQDIKKAIKEPLPTQHYLFDYKINIIQYKNKKGLLEVYRGSQKLKMPITEIQTDMLIVMSKNLKQRDKKKTDKDKGWTNVHAFKKEVPAWSKERTQNEQVRTQIKAIRDKLHDNNISRNLIKNRESMGYRISTNPDNITIER